MTKNTAGSGSPVNQTPPVWVSLTLPAIQVEREPEFGGSGWTLSLLIAPRSRAAAAAQLRQAADVLETGTATAKDYYRSYLNSSEWAERRRRALERSGKKCQACSSTERLEVHHNTYDRVGSELETDLFVMCDPCHEKIHGIAAA